MHNYLLVMYHNNKVFSYVYYSVQCDTLVSPDSGLVVVSSSGSTSIAEYTCVTGYTLYGETERACLKNGSWNLTAPSCGNSLYQGFVLYNGLYSQYSINMYCYVLIDNMQLGDVNI